MNSIKIYFGDNLKVLPSLADSSVKLIYIDPPFNTGKIQQLSSLKVREANDGDRKGFGGRTYVSIKISENKYVDIFDDYLLWLMPRLIEARRILASDGSLFFHIDYREVHYCKILLDLIFGRENYMNEIIWAWDYGARSKTKWPCKHSTILWYAKSGSEGDYEFNLGECDRIPYMSPELVGPEKAEAGKTPTDTWWHTIVGTNSVEKTGYPNQKPLGILERIVKVHSNEGDLLLDFFAGSGSFGEAAIKNKRNVILVDENEEAINVMERRFKEFEYIVTRI
jgi:site-specific DNA-methyltransferase (adenine-specific)